MQPRSIEIVVGAFILAGILSLAIIAFRVSGFNLGNKTSSYSVYARFENLGGLVLAGNLSSLKSLTIPWVIYAAGDNRFS